VRSSRSSGSGLNIFRIALLGWAEPLPDPEDLREQAKTRYVLREGAWGLMLPMFRAFLTSPRRLLGALGLAVRVSRRSDSEASSANRQLRGMLNKYANTVSADPSAILCQSAKLGCNVLLDGHILYADFDHLSLDGSIVLANALIAHHANFMAHPLFADAGPEITGAAAGP
jgi:hypothetical protein